MGTTKYLKMKTFALVLALVAVAAAKPNFEACPGFEDNSYVNPWHLSLNPDPVVAKEGAEVKVHFDATALKTLPVGTKVDIKMVKSGIPLPCLPVPGLPIHIGSCDYSADELLALIPADNGTKSFVLPNIPFIVRPFLSGDIEVTAKAINADGTEYLCMKNTVTVVTH